MNNQVNFKKSSDKEILKVEVSKEEFKDINATFTARLDRLNASLRDNERKKEKKLSLNVNDIPWIHEFLEFRNVTKLDRRVAVSLIESIVVYDKDRIEVIFHHMEELNEILTIADEIEVFPTPPLPATVRILVLSPITIS